METHVGPLARAVSDSAVQNGLRSSSRTSILARLQMMRTAARRERIVHKRISAESRAFVLFGMICIALSLGWAKLACGSEEGDLYKRGIEACQKEQWDLAVDLLTSAARLAKDKGNEEVWKNSKLALGFAYRNRAGASNEPAIRERDALEAIKALT